MNGNFFVAIDHGAFDGITSELIIGEQFFRTMDGGIVLLGDA